MSREREFGPDLVRAVAAALVVAVHFFLNTGFYDIPLTGFGMALAAWGRMLCMTCVPLFMVLSGWLCTSRRWGRGYLRGLGTVLVTWVLCGALCLIFRALRGEQFSVPAALLRFLDFTAAPYGWYVEMYVGLYLLMPFLNLAWAGLDRRGRDALTAVLLALSVAPSLTNAWHHLLPAFWTGIYPAAYYVLGAWLRDRRPKVPGVWLLLGWLLCAAGAAALRWTQAAGGAFSWTTYTDWNSPFVAAETACLFLLLVRCQGTLVPGFLRRLISRVARLSLPAYLLSYIFDSLFYPILNARVLTLPRKLPFLPLTVAAVLLCACLLSLPVDAMTRFITKKRGKPHGN